MSEQRRERSALRCRDCRSIRGSERELERCLQQVLGLRKKPGRIRAQRRRRHGRVEPVPTQ
jgi:hypothetical protein